MTTEVHWTDSLRAQMAGPVLAPSDPAYEDARRVHNGLIDRRPALVARCHGTADVQAAVRFARERGLEIAVRGGGHNVAGNAVCDGGLMIDLSAMRGVHVDPRARRARAQGGATWGNYNRETQLYGLASTGGVVSTTGVGGLTLGGGLGWLMGKHGMAVDCLRAVELVTASGEVVRASADEHSDLFWAVRGGGGNFGVATWLEYELYPVGPMVLGGLVAHPFTAARDVLRFYRDFTQSLPDDLTAFAGLLHAPDGSGAQIAAIMVCHAGSLEAGAAAVAPVKRFGSPVMDVIGPMPYSAVNMLFDAGFPRGALNYWKSSFLATLADGAIDTMIERFAAAPSPMSGLLLEHFHGAATRVGPTDTAFPHRTVAHNFLAVAEWLEASATQANVAWARDTYAALAPHFASGRYANYLNAEEVTQSGAVSDAFGPNWKRLREVKERIDPDNVFHLNQNIKP
ncbi:MAG: FAD-linked oxidase [Candidatus Rokuibacteriota bacterium]|jgi:FAD/FMN-containing dehydrogenase|nr:MAG: FAD-linked oxidase [Candidatus Rokubacteria bacterium]